MSSNFAMTATPPSPSYQQALDLFKAVGDQSGEANVLKAIGDVQQFRKENPTPPSSSYSTSP